MTPAALITISLHIENRYERYPMVITHVSHAVVDAPPADADAEDLWEWADSYLMPFTGTGKEGGDSWYDVTVTGCSDPALLGREFHFGY
jgi:hypothetical protein